MKCRLNNKLGEIQIDTEIIARYAGTAAMECMGIVGMASVNVKDGLVKLLKKDSLTRGINVTVSEQNKLRMDFHIVVAYGVSISAVADNLIENVKYKVEGFSGIEVEWINVLVEGVRVTDC